MKKLKINRIRVDQDSHFARPEDIIPAKKGITKSAVKVHSKVHDASSTKLQKIEAWAKNVNEAAAEAARLQQQPTTTHINVKSVAAKNKQVAHNAKWDRLRQDLDLFEHQNSVLSNKFNVITKLQQPPAALKDQDVPKTACNMGSQTHIEEKFTKAQQANLEELHTFMETDEYMTSGRNKSQDSIDSMYIPDQILEEFLIPQLVVSNDSTRPTMETPKEKSDDLAN
jgi:hypothetical protein